MGALREEWSKLGIEVCGGGATHWEYPEDLGSFRMTVDTHEEEPTKNRFLETSYPSGFSTAPAEAWSTHVPSLRMSEARPAVWEETPTRLRTRTSEVDEEAQRCAHLTARRLGIRRMGGLAEDKKILVTGADSFAREASTWRGSGRWRA